MHLDPVLAQGVVHRDALGARRRPARGVGQPELGGGDDVVARLQHRALDDIGQLAHVARPRVRAQAGARVVAEAPRRHAVVGAHAGQEVLGERDDVAAALAQRRQRHREHGQAMVEILAEAPLADGDAQVLVGRRHDPHVHGLVARGAEPPHHAVLQHLEELGLQRLRQQPDLVEEDRAAVGGLEEPGLRAPRVREGAPLEAEHLGLEQGLGDRRAVHVHERPIGARAGPVDHPREEALAGAGLALDEDRRQPPGLGGALEEPGDLLADGADARALAQEVAQGLHPRHLTPGAGSLVFKC